MQTDHTARSGLLFTGGQGPPPGILHRLLGLLSGRSFLVCAADSGLDTCLTAGYEPQGIVGDMDSLSDKALLTRFSRDIVEIAPCDKDETDTELGIAWLQKRGCENIILIGGGEGRLDHTMALLALFHRPFSPKRWLTARESVELVDRVWEGKGAAGQTLSVYPVGQGPWANRSQGLHWPLHRVSWKRDSVGLSNRFEGDLARIDVDRGRFLLIRPLRDLIQRG